MTSTALAVIPKGKKGGRDDSTLEARRRHAAEMIADGATRGDVRKSLVAKFGKGLGMPWINAAFRERKKAATSRARRREPRQPKLPGDARIACAFMAAGIPFSFDGRNLRLALEAEQ